MNLFWVSGFGLLGLAALAVPLVLHFLNRKPKERVEFPALEFLLRSEVKMSVSGDWRRRLILLLRLLAIAVAAFAFCQPYLTTLSGRNRSATVVLWDDSFSMRTSPEFEAMKLALETGLEACSHDRPMVLGLVRNRGIVWSGGFTGSRLELQEFFRKQARNFDVNSFAGLGVEVDRKLRELAAPERNVVLFTDRQALPWEELRRDAALRHATGFELKRPDARKIRNAAVSSVELFPDKETLTLRGEGRNWSEELVRGTLLVRLASGEEKKEPFEVEPHSGKSATLTLPRKAGDIAGLVRFDGGDDLALDDTFYFNSPADARATSAPPPPDGAINFPALAVDAPPEAAALPVSGVGKLLIEQNPAALSEERRRELEKFLASGGSVALVLDASARSAAFLDKFKVGLSPSHGLRTDLRHFGAFNFDHPVVKGMFSAGGAGAPEVLFFRSVRFRPPPEAVVVARFDDGEAAIVELPAGAGRLWLFGFSFDASSSAWSGHSSFLPFWRELEKYAARTGERSARPLGEACRVAEQAQFDAGAGFAVLSAENGFIRFDRPGNYRVDGRMYSVNLPAAESAYRVDAAERGFVVRGEPFDGEQIPETSKRELAGWLLLAAALFALSEFVLANRTAL